MLHVYYRWGMVSFLLIRYVCVCVCVFPIPISVSFSLYLLKVQRIREWSRKRQDPNISLPVFNICAIPILPSETVSLKTPRRGQVKRREAQLLYSCSLWIFYLFCICLFLTDYGCLWRKMEWSKWGNWFSHVSYDFLPPMIFLWRNSLIVLF